MRFEPHTDRSSSQVHLILDPNTKQPKGLAYVSFAKPEAALAAYEALDKTSFQGRLLHILPAVDRKGKVDEGDAEGKKRTLKEDRETKRKAAAGKEFNWAMLYMNVRLAAINIFRWCVRFLTPPLVIQSDAVVSSIADRMNVSKADILNPESDNAAVKLALAETHVIQETKTFLEQHGVDLSALETSGSRRPSRSDRIILVKNIPYGTSAADVRALFEPHGELRRVLVPPAGTIAVVEFVNADEGRKAFRAVAYRRLGNSIIYLEKGPEGMFISDEPITDVPAAVLEPVTATAAAPVVVPDTTTGGADEPPLSAGTTLFVKNLSFSTTPEKLTQVVRHLPDFAFARIQTKPDPARPGARLSMGYGFVGFRTPEGARRGLKSMEGTVLDGHKLVVKWAGRGAEEGEGAEDKEKVKARTTKMIVKNVPFEATKKDIRELFGCAHISSHVFWIRANSTTAVRMRSLSLSGYLASSTIAHAVSRSSSSHRATRRNVRTPRSSIPIFSDAIWCWSGQKRAMSMSTSSERRRESAMAVALRCPGGRGSWRWEMEMERATTTLDVYLMFIIAS